MCDRDGASGGDPANGVCVFGQCCAKTRGCHNLDRCVPGQGTCMQRLTNQTDIGVPTNDDRDALEDKRYLVSPGLTMLVRYCKCADGFVGPLCSTKMQPLVPLVYVIVGFLASTGLLFLLLDRKELLQAPRRADRRIEHGVEGVGQRELALKCLSFLLESFMMASGVFSYSVQWSKDFTLIAVLRFLAHSVLEAFSAFSHLFLPDSWSSRDTFSIQIMFSTALPMMMLAHAWASRVPDPTTNELELTAGGITIVYTVLPLFTIPTVGVLFKPIVSCHLQADFINPSETAAEDQYYVPRSAPPEELFLPPSERTDCSYGKATTDYFWLGFCLLVPFWLIGLYFGTQGGRQQRFALLRGYQAWHTQLLVGCAMAYRAFKRHHPKMLCLTLLVLNVVELGLVWRWRPCDMHLLNAVRLSGALLAVIWCGIGVTAATIADSADDTSGMLLLMSMAVWGAVVLHGWQARRGRVVGVAGVALGAAPAIDGAGGEGPRADDSMAVVGGVLGVVLPTFETEERQTGAGANSSTGRTGGNIPVGTVASGVQQPSASTMTETTANPLSVPRALPVLSVPIDARGRGRGNRSAPRVRRELNAEELQARKERSDRARANMRRAALAAERGAGGRRGGGGGGMAGASSSGGGGGGVGALGGAMAQLDIDALLERQQYLQRPEVERFLTGLVRKTASFLSFPYVCPEPVLAK
jgi:hypothetical protein